MKRLLDVMRTLRSPGGCPWDQEQTHLSLRKYLLEEACEAMDAIASDDTNAMVEELGDVLLQVAFHAVIGEEADRFGYADIEDSIVDKLIRRHPHVFAGLDVADAEEVVQNWQEIKAQEKASSQETEIQVPHSLPALMRAEEVAKAAHWPVVVHQEVEEALARANHAKDAAAMGELLLAVVDFARASGVNPELALRDALETKLQPSS